MIRAVIFDMDGVLSDTERLHVQSEERQLSRLGIDPGVLAGGAHPGNQPRQQPGCGQETEGDAQTASQPGHAAHRPDEQVV